MYDRFGCLNTTASWITGHLAWKVWLKRNCNIFSTITWFMSNITLSILPFLSWHSRHFVLSTIPLINMIKADKRITGHITGEKIPWVSVFFLPYIGLPAIVFSRKLKELLKKYYCIDIIIVFTSFKVNNYFSLKCCTPLPLLANVVYKFKCLRDANNIYIGKTIWHLATRVKEHGTSSSAVSNHLSSCETCKLNFSCDSFSIIDSEKNDFEITVKEVLHIKVKKPTIDR